MSRLVVFDSDNHAVGSFQATCNRGWMVYGNPGVDGAGETTVDIPRSVMSEKWLQLGALVLVQHNKLPAWCGVIDAPWKATLPGKLTLYNAEYLFSTRTPEAALKFTGTVAGIVEELIRIANQQEELNLSIGEDSGDKLQRDVALDQRTLWDQLIDLLESSGHEMVFRPEVENKELVLYADIGTELGTDTAFLLHDAKPNPNCKLISATVDGEIWNRVKGVSGQSTAEDQLQTDILEDEDSQGFYRTRSTTQQFRNITELSILTENARTFLDQHKQPYIDIDVDILDVGEAFINARPGNTLRFRSGNIYLPGGVIGWRGSVRLLVAVYDESKNTIRAKLRGTL